MRMSLLQGIGGAPIPERQKPARPSPVDARFVDTFPEERFTDVDTRPADTRPTDTRPAQAQQAVAQAVEAQPVSRLLEFYRSKHSAWVAEAESLAQLRDQVRSAADRETLEIVARARKDVRDVIAIARQELLVLTEQVRAVLGENEPPLRTIEALRDDNWLPASVARESTHAQDVHATVTLVPSPSASVTSAVNDRDIMKRDGDWGAEFDSLIREADDETRRW
jgi:hypothetical protein